MVLSSYLKICKLKLNLQHLFKMNLFRMKFLKGKTQYENRNISYTRFNY